MPEKYLQEIEDILKQVRLPGRRPRRRSLSSSGMPLLRILSLSPGKLLLAALVLLLTALLIQGRAPGLVGWLFWIGLLLLIGAYALYFRRVGSAPERKWRGRAVDGSVPSWWRRLRQRSKG